MLNKFCKAPEGIKTPLFPSCWCRWHNCTPQRDKAKTGAFVRLLGGLRRGLNWGHRPEAAATLGKAHAAASRLTPSRDAPSPGLWIRRQSSSNRARPSGQLHRVSLPGAAPHRHRWQSTSVVSLSIISRHHRGLNNSGKECRLNHLSGLGRGRLCTRRKSKR